MRPFLAIPFALALLAGPAFADCAADLAQADEMLKTATLDEATMTKVKAAQDAAKAAQTSGDTAACDTAAAELKTLLGIKSQ
jgi:hypothetical protein